MSQFVGFEMAPKFQSLHVTQFQGPQNVHIGGISLHISFTYRIVGKGIVNNIYTSFNRGIPISVQSFGRAQWRSG